MQRLKTVRPNMSCLQPGKKDALMSLETDLTRICLNGEGRPLLVLQLLHFSPIDFMSL
jgi:hypothetical protein